MSGTSASSQAAVAGLNSSTWAPARIADMDQAGIGMQVLSAVTPGAQNLAGADGVAYARKLNSWVANEVIPVYPDRFRAFATLPLSEPEAAADELERSVREHGFVGCMSYGAIDGKYLDHVDFEPVLGGASGRAGYYRGSSVWSPSSRCWPSARARSKRSRSRSRLPART